MDTKAFLNKFTHKDLKEITRELNLHTILKVSKLSKEQLVNELSQRTKIKDGKLVISIPEKELKLPAQKPKLIKKASPVSVTPELSNKISMSIKQFTSSIPQILEIKAESAQATNEGSIKPLLEEKKAIAEKTINNIVNIVEDYTENKDLSHAQTKIVEATINYINEVPAINTESAQNLQIDADLEDAVELALNGITPFNTNMEIDNDVFSNINLDIPVENKNTLPVVIAEPEKTEETIEMFDDYEPGGFSFGDLEAELNSLSQANETAFTRLGTVPEPEKPIQQEQIIQPAPTQETLQIIANAVTQAITPIVMQAQPATVPKPVAPQPESRTLEDIQYDLNELLTGIPRRELESESGRTIRFIPREVIKTINDNDILDLLYEDAQRFRASLEQGAEQKKRQLIDGMINAISNQLAKLENRPRGRPKKGMSETEIMLNYINTLTPEQKEAAELYINSRLTELKKVLDNYVVTDARSNSFKPISKNWESGGTYKNIEKQIGKALSNSAEASILMQNGINMAKIAQIIDYKKNDLLEEADRAIYKLDRDVQYDKRLDNIKAGLADGLEPRNYKDLTNKLVTNLQSIARGFISRRKTAAKQQPEAVVTRKQQVEREFTDALAGTDEKLISPDLLQRVLNESTYPATEARIQEYITRNRIKTQVKNRLLTRLKDVNDKFITEKVREQLALYKKMTEDQYKDPKYFEKQLLESDLIKYADSGEMATLYNLRKLARAAKTAKNSEKLAQLVNKFIAIYYNKKVLDKVKKAYPGYNLSMFQ